MNKLVKRLIAEYGAKKLGGCCLSRVIIFFVIWYGKDIRNGIVNNN